MIRILGNCHTFVGTLDLFTTSRLFYITLFVALLFPAITAADTNSIIVPGFKSQKQNSIFIDDEVLFNAISCDANFKESYLYDKNEIRTRNREALLSSVDERMLKSCEMDSKEVQRRLLSKSVVLVDTRSANEFESYRIPGSLNLSPFEIKSKSFLKPKHLVIVGNRANLLEMGLLCHELKQHGFKKVNFIKGGLGSWDKKLIGRDAYSIDGWMFGKITPREFVSLKSKMEWLILDVSNNDPSKNGSKFIYDGLKVIPFEIANMDSLGKVKNHMASFLNKNLYGFLIISNHGDRYSEVGKYLRKNKVNNVYFLDGGMTAYAKYFAVRKVFLARLQRGPVKLSSCSSI